MGYTHDTNAALFLSPFDAGYTAGTWTPTIASNTHGNVRTATAASFSIIIPVTIEANYSALKGFKVNSIDVFYKIATADGTACTWGLDLETLPAATAAPGTALSGVAVTCTLDALHNTAALCYAQGSHTATITVTTPVWLDAKTALIASLSFTAAATTAFTYWGSRVNGIWRL